MDKLSVTAIEHEQGRFYVQSRSRADVVHVVDLMWQEEPWHKPRGACWCESCAAKGRTFCPHLEAVVKHEQERLKI